VGSICDTFSSAGNPRRSAAVGTAVKFSGFPVSSGGSRDPILIFQRRNTKTPVLAVEDPGDEYRLSTVDRTDSGDTAGGHVVLVIENERPAPTSVEDVSHPVELVGSALSHQVYGAAHQAEREASNWKAVVRTSVTESQWTIRHLVAEAGVGRAVQQNFILPDGAPPMLIELGALLSKRRTGPGSNVEITPNAGLAGIIGVRPLTGKLNFFAGDHLPHRWVRGLQQRRIGVHLHRFTDRTRFPTDVDHRCAPALSVIPCYPYFLNPGDSAEISYSPSGRNGRL
jgi:hypothetical protein